MARVALLITVLAAMAYISQAIPVPENVEDEQLNSKEIQPEFNENIDQIQSNEDILDQDQPESNENHDQIQPKSEESSSQLDDTSEHQLEDSKNTNKNSHNHNQHLEKVIKKLEELLGTIENKRQKENIERKLDRLEQRSRQNSRYPRSIDENQIKVNDIKELFENYLQKISQIISDKSISQIGEDIQKEVKETKSKLDEYIKEFFGKNTKILNNVINKIKIIADKVNEAFEAFIAKKKSLVLGEIEKGKEHIKNIANLGKSIIGTEIEDGISKIGDVQKRFEDSKNILRDSTKIFLPKFKRD